MNALASIPSVRALPLGPSFTCWRIANGKAIPYSVTSTTLANVEREIAIEATYGTTMLVVETTFASQTRSVLHAYQIRRGKWAGELAPYGTRRIYPHLADRLFAVGVTDFDPVEPWHFTPGSDVVGVDPNLIEGRPYKVDHESHVARREAQEMAS